MKAETITITRRVKIYVAEDDKDLKKDYIHKIYEWRDACRKAANMVVAHKFCQQNIKDFVYLKDEIKEKFNASSRNMPFDQEKHAFGETCVCCGKKARKVMYFAKAY